MFDMAIEKAYHRFENWLPRKDISSFGLEGSSKLGRFERVSKACGRMCFRSTIWPEKSVALQSSGV